MEKIEFQLFGLSLLEPLSTGMNWVLSTQCFMYYFRLKKVEEPTTFHRFWTWFFLAYAIAFIFGGTSHLFFNYFGMAGKIPNYSLSLLAVMAAEFALIQDVADPKKKNILIQVIRSMFFATIVMLIYDFSFKWVMFQLAGFFLFLMVISIKRYKSGIKEYRHFLWGVGCLLLMGPIKIFGLDIHPSWFTRDDIAHIFMVFAFWMFYKSIVAISQRQPAPNEV